MESTKNIKNDFQCIDNEYLKILKDDINNKMKQLKSIDKEKLKNAIDELDNVYNDAFIDMFINF